MDIVTLTAFLTPFLPYLLKAGEKAAEEAGKQLGEKLGADTWVKAKALWGKLQPKVEAKPMAKGAAEELANSPKDEDAKEILQKQLKKLLDEDQALAAEIARLLEENPETVAKAINTYNVAQNVTGDYNKSIAVVQGDGTIN